MNHNIIHKQRFILAKTEADFKKEDAEGLICGCDIAFIVEPGNKDICTHGIYMLKEIKNDISQLKNTVENHEVRITDNETDIQNLKISLNNLESRVTVNERNIENLDTRITNVEQAIIKIKRDITNINETINNFKTEVNNKFEQVNNKITAINTTAVTIKIVTSLPSISTANNHTIYLVPSTDQFDNNVYTEYILQNGEWEVIGIQKSDLNLEDYVTLNKLTQDLSNYYTKTQTDNLLNGKANSNHTHTKNQITDFPTFKTINGQSITGSGNLTIQTDTDLSDYYTKSQCDAKYLTSHQTLKTINGQSLVGSGNITIEAGSDFSGYWNLSGSTLSPVDNSYEVSAKTFYASSDAKLKKDVKNISDEDITRLKDIDLHEYSFNNETVKRYGVIAQELQNAGLTNLVGESDGKLSVDYTSLIILYIESLKKEIEILKQRMSNYEQKTSNEERLS